MVALNLIVFSTQAKTALISEISYIYRIFLNRNRGHYFFIFLRFLRLLFEGGFYFFYIKDFILKLMPSGHSDLCTMKEKKAKQ